MSRLTISQPAVREVEVHQSRQTATGSRNDASSCHATGATDEPGVAASEDGAGEQQQERDLAVVERVEELGARDLEVVGAGDGQVDLGRAVERR